MLTRYTIRNIRIRSLQSGKIAQQPSFHLFNRYAKHAIQRNLGSRHGMLELLAKLFRVALIVVNDDENS